VRRVLTDVYAALEIAWRPETAGSLDEHHPAVTVDDVEGAIVAGLGGAPLWRADPATEALAAQLAVCHRGDVAPGDARRAR
jgi:hypothetical protein